jgi:hypothetical protein
VKVFITLLLLVGAARSQVMEVSGGSSSLFDASGGSITAYLPDSILKLSGGTDQGHSGVGISDTFKYDGYSVTVGSSQFGYSVDGVGGAGLASNGIAVSKLSQTQSLAAFIGVTGPMYNLPYFSATEFQHVGAGLFFQRRAGRFNLQSLAAFSGGQRTAVQSGSYVGNRIRFAGGAGLLQGRGVSNGVLDVNPVRTWHLTAMRQDLFWQSLRAGINSLSTSANLGFLSVNASVLEGNSGTRRTTGQTAGVGVHAGFLNFQSSVYGSAGSRLLLQTASEQSRHWRLTETYQSGNGHSVAFGGAYTSNRLTFSVDHSIMFMPFAGAAFQQVTAVALSFRLRGYHVNLGTSLIPIIGPKYTASVSSFVKGPLDIQSRGPQMHGSAGGKFLISGRVTDRDGAGLEGAAVVIGHDTVITDSSGAFFVRVRKPKTQTMRVATDQFSAPGNWRVVTAPCSIEPDVAVTVTVERQQ